MPFEREGTKRAKKILAMESACELIAIFSATMVNLSVKGETGSVKGETRSANFWQGKV